MRLAVIVALLCVAGWTGAVQAADPASTANPSIQAQGSTGEGGSTHQPLIMSPDEKLIEGQVIDYKTVDMQNEKDHRVVQLKLKDGQTMQVDLGAKSNLPSGFDVRKGQWVLVAGVPSQMGNERVFVAHRWANVYNLSTAGGTPSAPKESLPGEKDQGSKGSDSDYNAH